MLMQAELKEKLASMYDVKDVDTIFVFGFRTQVRQRAWAGPRGQRMGTQHVAACLGQPGRPARSLGG